MTFRASVEFDDQLTWGNLYDLVDLARGSGVDRDEKVTQVMVDNHDEMLDRIEVEIPGPLGRGPVVLSAAEAAAFGGAIETVLVNQGDARGVLADLSELHTRLLFG